MRLLSTPQANLSSRAGSPAALLRLLLFLPIVWLGALSSRLPAQTPLPEQQVVTIKQMHFNPARLNVKPGDLVQWKNEDIFTHTVSADDGSFDSGPIAPGGSWQTTIHTRGPLGYHCRPHPNMTAQLISGEQGKPEQDHDHSERGQGTLRWSPPTRPDEIHPILVNFTAALLPIALLSDLLGRIFREKALYAVGLWMMVYEAAITPVTVIAGWWWKYTQANQLPAKLIAVHQWLGTAAAFLFILLAVWRWRFYRHGTPPSWAYLGCALVATLALIYQGSLGGSLVFGH